MKRHETPAQRKARVRRYWRRAWELRAWLRALEVPPWMQSGYGNVERVDGARVTLADDGDYAPGLWVTCIGGRMAFTGGAEGELVSFDVTTRTATFAAPLDVAVGAASGVAFATPAETNLRVFTRTP